MSLKRLAAACAAGALAACASAPEPIAPSPTIGRLYTYVRSNQDGSLAETIYVYRASETRVEVGKMVDRCTNAAFVTADLDLVRNQPRELIGGRIARDGSQDAFAWLTYDPGARELHARVPAMNLDVRTPVEHEPWRIYDFDLAELTTLSAGRAPTREDFEFGVALIWPAEGEANPFRYLGLARATYVRSESGALVFNATGALNGELKLDDTAGHVVEANFAEPNHTGYENFRLVLRDVEDDAAETWRGVRLAHWAGCP